MRDAERLARGRRFLRRVLVRPAAGVHAALVIAIVLPYAWLARAWPPHEIRRALAEMPDLARGVALTVVWGLWLVACLPATRALLCSRQSTALRSLPLGGGDWARSLLPALLAFQCPVALVVAYGAASLGSVWPALAGLGLALVAAMVQPHLVTRRRSAAWAWICVLFVPVGAIVFGVRATVLVAVAGASASYVAGYRLPFGERRSTRRWLRRAPRPAWALARPTVLSVVRCMPRWLAGVVVAQVVLAGHLYFGLVNGAATPGDALTGGVLWLGAAMAVALALAGGRRVAGSAWYLESLPVHRGLAVVALAIPAFSFTTPAVAATGAATLWATEGRAWTVAFVGLTVALWAGCFAAWVVLDQDSRRRPAQHVKWMAFACLPAAAMVISDRVIAALPFAFLFGWLAWRIEPRARSVRRRFELDREPEGAS